LAESRLKIDVRRNRVLDVLRRDGRVCVSELSRSLGATPVTIRNDLAALERDGHLVRVSGGAVLAQQGEPSVSAERMDIKNMEEKIAIAGVVARMIRDGDTLFINSGTTTQLIAAELRVRRNLNIVTNSIKVAERLGTIPTFRVLLLGGELNASYGFTCGGDAQEQLGRYRADWAILSVDGISADAGVTTYHAEEAAIDRMMADGARQVLIAADRTKIGRAGFSRVCDCYEGLCIVTGSGESGSELFELQQQGVTVIRA